jgi:hypothetical protein
MTTDLLEPAIKNEPILKSKSLVQRLRERLSFLILVKKIAKSNVRVFSA